MVPVTFCTRLKEQTAAAHRRAESQAFIMALKRGELNVRSLVLMLEQLQPVYEELEAQLACAGDHPWVALFDHRRLDRAARLRRDLDRLGRVTAPTLGRGTRTYVAAVRASAASPQRLLAHHYTRYMGDLAGGQVIARLVERHYGLSPSHLSYLDFSDLGDPVHYRKQYRALLDLLPWSPTEQAEFITECEVAFDVNARMLEALAVSSGLETPSTPSGAAFLSGERGHLAMPRSRHACDLGR